LSNGLIVGEPATAQRVPAGLVVTGALAFQSASVAAWADRNLLSADRLFWPALVLEQHQIANPGQSVDVQRDSAAPEATNHRAVVDAVFAQLTDEMDYFAEG
jgi:hypothetical protein